MDGVHGILICHQEYMNGYRLLYVSGDLSRNLRVVGYGRVVQLKDTESFIPKLGKQFMLTVSLMNCW